MYQNPANLIEYLPLACVIELSIFGVSVYTTNVPQILVTQNMKMHHNYELMHLSLSYLKQNLKQKK